MDLLDFLGDVLKTILEFHISRLEVDATILRVNYWHKFEEVEKSWIRRSLFVPIDRLKRDSDYDTSCKDIFGELEKQKFVDFLKTLRAHVKAFKLRKNFMELTSFMLYVFDHWFWRFRVSQDELVEIFERLLIEFCKRDTLQILRYFVESKNQSSSNELAYISSNFIA